MQTFRCYIRKDQYDSYSLRLKSHDMNVLLYCDTQACFEQNQQRLKALYEKYPGVRDMGGTETVNVTGYVYNLGYVKLDGRNPILDVSPDPQVFSKAEIEILGISNYIHTDASKKALYDVTTAFLNFLHDSLHEIGKDRRQKLGEAYLAHLCSNSINTDKIQEILSADLSAETKGRELGKALGSKKMHI